jgi:hypothetical protein
MRRLALAVVTAFIASLAIISTSPAQAEEATCVGAFVPTESATASVSSTAPTAPNSALCHGTLAAGSSTNTGATPVGLVSNGGGTTSAGKKYEPYDKVVPGPDGTGCVTTGYKEVGTGRPADGAVPIGEQQFPNGTVSDPTFSSRAVDYNNVYQDYPPCPEQPRAPGEPAPVVTRAMVAARYWEQVPLPYPKPAITYTNDTIFGPLQIVSTGRYYVDWGDGKGETGPYSVEGGAWPDGRITHQYTHVGTYNIQVTEKWVGQWQLGGESGTLRTLETSGTIANFPVQQIQAVIGR